MQSETWRTLSRGEMLIFKQVEVNQLAAISMPLIWSYDAGDEPQRTISRTLPHRRCSDNVFPRIFAQSRLQNLP
jgi:hypothetical protein